MLFLLLFSSQQSYFCIIHTNTITNVYSVGVFYHSLRIITGFRDKEGTREFLFALPRFAADEVRKNIPSPAFLLVWLIHHDELHRSAPLMHSLLFLHCRLTVLAVNENLILVRSRWYGIRPVMWSRNTEKHQTQFSIRPQRRMHTKWQQGSIQCPPQEKESWSIRSNHMMYN